MKKILLIAIFLLLFTFLFTPTVLAAPTMDTINRLVCDRFEEDLNKLAAIMEEVRARKGITETRVAFGGIDTPIKSADYWITYGAEALSYQRSKKYSAKGELKYSLEVLKDKVLRAKTEVGKAINEN